MWMSINVVVSRYHNPVDWVYRLTGVNQIFVYEKENPNSPYNVPVNKGQEASAYLKYVVDHYDVLADYTFFTHDEEYSWHHKGNIVDLFYEAKNSGRLYYNINEKCILGSIMSNPLYPEIIEWYKTYIERYIPMDNLPNIDFTVGNRGSAQFLVHRCLIRRLPRVFYEDLYNWIITTHLTNYATSRFMEWTWHLFWDVYYNPMPHLLNKQEDTVKIYIVK